MKVRNLALGGTRPDKFPIGSTALKAIYIGETMIYGGTDDTIIAADVGLTIDAGTPVYYLEGEMFGDIGSYVVSSDANYFAWGGYNTPESVSNAVTVYHYDGLPPAFYASGSAVSSLTHYGSTLSAGLYFVVDDSTLVRGYDTTTGASFSWRINYDGHGGKGMYAGPTRNAVPVSSGGYQFAYAGGPLSSYISMGNTVSVGGNEATMKHIWDSMMANAGKRLVF